MEYLKRTWAQINLDAIANNYNIIKDIASKHCKIMAVIKADGYGHGALPVAFELKEHGADYFAVSNIEEAIALRNGGINDNILILGYTPCENADKIIKYSLTQTVFSLKYAKKLADFAKKDSAVIKAHIKIDTGMGRLGFVYYGKNDSICEIKEACMLENLNFEGIFTHFSSADMPSKKNETFKQFDLFCSVTDKLKEENIVFSLRHCCNSGALLDYPHMHLDMIRPGIILYGLLPSNEINNKPNLTPAMSLKTAISQIKTVPKGTTVSYGQTYTAKKESLLATLPIGYADGFYRLMSNKGRVMINDTCANIVGRVCMDQTIVDVTNIPGCNEESIVTVFGQDKKNSIPVEDISELSGTINYEIVCDVGKRVSRIYLKNGKKKGILNYIV